MYIDEAKKARKRIEDIIVKTPLLHSDIFSKLSSNNVFMKCENLQVTGAYKIRGALNKISQLSKEEKIKGVVCSSAGNHAQGVAYASSILGIESTIVMPKTTPYLKVQSTKNYGGNTVLFGSCYDDAFLEAKRIEKEEGKVFIPPFDDFDIICPVGGGGLISGISLVAKSLNPGIKIIGVQASGAPSMYESINKGERITLEQVNTIADGIAVKSPGEKTFEIIDKYVDEIVTVTEGEIVDAFLLLSEKHKLLGEASGVVSLAALNKLNCKDKKICSIISGGNIDMLTISNLINNGLVSGGRLFCFSVELPDVPGQLVDISQILSEENANVVKLEHNQFKAMNRINNVLLEVTVETNGHEHINKIIKHFNSKGYKINIMYKG